MERPWASFCRTEPAEHRAVPSRGGWLIAASECDSIPVCTSRRPRTIVVLVSLAFATLGFNTLVWLVLRNEEWLTGGTFGINNIARPELFGLDLSSNLKFYYFILGVTGGGGGGVDRR